jgi:hypothetical protein
MYVARREREIAGSVVPCLCLCLLRGGRCVCVHLLLQLHLHLYSTRASVPVRKPPVPCPSTHHHSTQSSPRNLPTQSPAKRPKRRGTVRFGLVWFDLVWCAGSPRSAASIHPSHPSHRRSAGVKENEASDRHDTTRHVNGDSCRSGNGCPCSAVQCGVGLGLVAVWFRFPWGCCCGWRLRSVVWGLEVGRADRHAGLGGIRVRWSSSPSWRDGVLFWLEI